MDEPAAACIANRGSCLEYLDCPSIFIESKSPPEACPRRLDIGMSKKNGEGV